MSEYRDDAESGFNGKEATSVQQHLRVLQIICASLIGGVLIFGGFVLLQPPQPPATEPVMAFVGAGFAAVGVMTWLLLPMLIDRAAAKRVAQTPQEDGRPAPEAVAAALMPQYHGRKIMSMAVLEGAAFMNLVAYWLEHLRWSLAIVGGLVLLMIVSFPTRGRLHNWAQSLIQRWETRSFSGER
jgi:hypothetical protein